MKKLLFTLLMVFYFFNVFSQQITWNQRLNAIKAIDSVLRIYEDNLTFTDVASDSISAKATKKFKSVFTADATIFDDLNPDFFDDPHNKGFRFRLRTVDDFLARTKEIYPRGLVEANITNMAISYDDLSQHRALVAIEKKVSAYAYNGWQVEIIDTLLLSLKLSSDFRGAQITGISEDGIRDGYVNYKIINDSDGDLVIDEDDVCPDVPGYIIYKGCGPPVLPFSTLLLRGVIGGSNANYSPADYEHGSRLGYSLSAEYENFLVWKRHLGFGIGGMYSILGSNLNIDYYYKEFEDFEYVSQIGDATSYKRIISSTGQISENITFQYLSLQAYVKYKTKLSTKWGIKLNLGVGASFPIATHVKFDKDATNSFNYEAVYDTMSDNSIGYVKVLNNPGSALLFTEDFLNDIGQDPVVFFTMLNAAGYDLALNSIPSNPTKNPEKFKPNVVYSLNLTLTYLIGKDNYLNFGPQFLYEKHWNKESKAEIENNYKLTNKIIEYNTLLAGSEFVEHIYVGVTVGVSFNLSKKYIDPNVY